VEDEETIDEEDVDLESKGEIEETTAAEYRAHRNRGHACVGCCRVYT
jgi:hypothetical protein